MLLYSEHSHETCSTDSHSQNTQAPLTKHTSFTIVPSTVYLVPHLNHGFQIYI